MLPQFTSENIARFWSKVDRSGGDDACWLWTAGLTPKGYGRFCFSDTWIGAHRFAWLILRGEIGAGLCVCHDCPGGDNPQCCNPSHCFLGTRKDNREDCVAKGRQARGETHMSRTHPEALQRGDQNGSRRYPERLKRGDQNGSRLYPERLMRGESHLSAKLTEDDVRRIRSRYAAGGISHAALGREFGVYESTIAKIVARKTWAHVK